MFWKKIQRSQNQGLQASTRTLGPQAVNLQSHLENDEQQDNETTQFWVCSNTDLPDLIWHGLIVIRSQTILPWFLPTFQQESLLKASEKILKHLGSSFTLMGPRAQTAVLEPFFPPSYLIHRVAYDFMFRPSYWNGEPLILPPLAEIIQLNPLLAPEIFSLQEAYEKEEVLFSASDFHPTASLRQFQKSLQNGLHLGLRIRSQWICKAGTNAWTRDWAQLGGIYTQPSWRGQGWQKLLVSELTRRLALTGRGTCLFVKKSNHAARELYLRLGFQLCEDFEISYWER